MKSQIIDHLGKTGLLLPALVAEGLAANDRVKVRLAVLQAAGQHAREPDGPAFDLHDDCGHVGIDPAPLAELVAGATLAGGMVSAPGLTALLQAIRADVATMARPVRAENEADGEAALSRLEALDEASPELAADTLAIEAIARLTAISGDGADSLHRLVMDLHKALNALAAAHAEEIVAGAHVYGLRADDKPAVEAFMRGIAATKPLKFDHPGLGATASRSGDRLTIQDDIGETDAHVVVITVEAASTTITYTDVHRARAKFFTHLFSDFDIAWSGLDRHKAKQFEDGGFYLVTGRLATAKQAERDAFLEAIGAALVFLIDWNKARKVLRDWVPRDDAIAILDWAARNRVGHRGFLQLGGRDLIAAAVHHAAPMRIGFGERLDQVLGPEGAVDFLKSALRISTEALLQGGSLRLARDRIEAELARHLQRLDTALLAVVIRQAGLARSIADGIATFIADQAAGRPFDQTTLAARARAIEEKADGIAIETRGEIVRFEADRSIERLVNRVEEAIDELEQAAFIASLVPAALPAELLAPLGDLCAAAIAGTEAVASGIAAAADVPEGGKLDVEDALACAGRLIEAEHAGDAAERAVTATVLRNGFDLTTALSVLDLTRALERATDHMAGFGHLLRDRVLTDLSG